jgi:hypothetical protein
VLLIVSAVLAILFIRRVSAMQGGIVALELGDVGSERAEGETANLGPA